MATLRTVLYDEVSTCAGHAHHATCNCWRTVGSILQRMRSDPEMVLRWLDQEGLLPENAKNWRLG